MNKLHAQHLYSVRQQAAVNAYRVLIRLHLNRMTVDSHSAAPQHHPVSGYHGQADHPPFLICHAINGSNKISFLKIELIGLGFSHVS